MKNGLENYFVIKDNKKMRFGYTTGSSAAAAAKAAAEMLFSGKDVPVVELLTTKRDYAVFGSAWMQKVVREHAPVPFKRMAVTIRM